MPNKPRRKKDNKDIDQQYCKSCQDPISINTFISEKLDGQCNRCFNDNTNENDKRKLKKKKDKTRRAERDFKRNKID